MAKDLVLVVGAAGGIGLATVEKLVDEGYRVVGTVKDEAEASLVRSQVPGIADLAIVSLWDAVAAREAFSQILAGSGAKVTGVVGCAGVATYGAVETTPIEEYRSFLEVNTFANLALYQAALPFLRESKGKVIIVSSYFGTIGFPLFSQYSVSKHALEGLMSIARLEAAQWGVDVSLIVPGGVKTGMTSDLPSKLEACFARIEPAKAGLYRDYFSQYAQLMASSLDSFSNPESVADKVLLALAAQPAEPRYVVGDDASWILDQKRTLGEREFDALLATMLPGSLAQG